MRVVFDCERMKYPDTGLYHYCMNLGKALEHAANPQREQLFFYTPPGEQAWSNTRANHITQNSLHKFWFPNVKPYTIWHTTYQSSNYIPKKNKRLKVVLTVHDLNFLHDEKKSGEKKQQHLQSIQARIDQSDAIICVSQFSQQELLAHCNVEKKPLFVIHNGTNELEKPELNTLSYKPKKPFLFSIGVMNRKKNYHVLLPLLQNNRLELLIAGKNDDANYLSYLNDRARQLGVTENMRLLGPISEREKSWYFNYCSAFAFPSISEGFGLPVVEAMSCGKPLFLSDRTALPEIGGNVSFYFNDFQPDHMQQVFHRGMKKFNANGLREEIRKRGHDFCWEKAASQYLDVYRSLY